jgi:peroxiredoxin
MRKLLPLIGGLLLGLGVGVIIFFGFLNPDDGIRINANAEGAGSLPVPTLDEPAPAFDLTSLSGEQVYLEDYRGQVVVLNFWATWCAPCRLEMPAFQSRSTLYPDEIVVVAINNAEDPQDIQTFVDELRLDFEILLDPDAAVQRLYLVRGYPTTFIIDQEGVIRVQHVGLINEDQLDRYLADLGVPEN